MFFRWLMQLKYHYLKDYTNCSIPYTDILLTQLGTAYCEPSTLVEEHDHNNFWELSIITSGKGTIYTNGVGTEVREGDIYISLNLERHKIISDNDFPLKYDFFAFTITNDEFKKELLSIENVLRNPNNRIIRNDTIKMLFQSALAETSLDRYGAEKYIDMLFSQIIIQLIRTLKKQNVGYSSLPSKNEELCYQIMHYINTHLSSISSLETLSEIFNYDYKYLSNIFTKTTKQTLSNYVRVKRLERACTLLKEGKYSLTQISEKLHYSSLYSFSKAFKKQYGISPKNYIHDTQDK